MRKLKEELLMKKILSLVLVGVLTLGMTACGSPKSAEDTKSEVTTIKVHSGNWNRPEESQYIREILVPQFEEENPNIDVEFEFAQNTNDQLKTLEAQKASDKWEDDVVIIHDGNMGYTIDKGYVTDITEFKNNSGLTFLKAFDESTNMDGKSYFLPVSADVYLTIVNKEAYDYLPEGIDTQNLTREDYVAWSNSIREAVGPKTVLGYEPVKSALYQVGAIGLSYGATFPDVSSEGFKSAMNLVAQMADDYVADGAYTGNPTELLRDGQGLLTFYHMGPVSEVYASAPAQYDVLPAPKGPEGAGSIAGTWGVGITPGGTKKIEASEKFVEWFTSPKVLLDVVKNTGGTIPPIKEVIELLDEGDATEVVIMKGLDTLNNGTVSGTGASNYQDFGAVKNVYDSILTEVLSTKTVNDEFLNEKQVELDALLK